MKSLSGVPISCSQMSRLPIRRRSAWQRMANNCKAADGALCRPSTRAEHSTDSAIACSLRLPVAHRIVAGLSQYFAMEYSVKRR
jgi:hypothetical protein